MGETDRRGIAGAGARNWRAPASRPINETKLAIIAVMEDFDRPVTSAELYAVFDRVKTLKAIEYHLCTLVGIGAAELITDPGELRFRLSRSA